jgi:hypothetical protein
VSYTLPAVSWPGSTRSALDASWPFAIPGNVDAIVHSCDTTWDAAVSLAVVIVDAIPGMIPDHRSLCVAQLTARRSAENASPSTANAWSGTVEIDTKKNASVEAVISQALDRFSRRHRA